jgi:hypothetical protein
MKKTKKAAGAVDGWLGAGVGYRANKYVCTGGTAWESANYVLTENIHFS